MYNTSHSQSSGLCRRFWKIGNTLRNLAEEVITLEAFEALLSHFHQEVCDTEDQVLRILPGVSEQVAEEIDLALRGLTFQREGLERMAEFVEEDDLDHLEIGYAQVQFGYELQQDALTLSEQKRQVLEQELRLALVA